MLIGALCDYYDILAKEGKVLPNGYSNVNVNYMISLTTDGYIDEIIDIQKKEAISDKGGKIRERTSPKKIVMPQRTEKPGIDANIIEHRPLYIFGLNYDTKSQNFYAEDRTDKAKKSHDSFVKKNLEFLEGLHSPVIDAYRNFIINWKSTVETENVFLKEIGKDYSKSGYVFCLTGAPDSPLHEDTQIQDRWVQYINHTKIEDDAVIAQCAISGKEEEIARIHGKIKGIIGGQSSGTVLVSFKNPSESSYGNDQSYNSNISESNMKKYTEALNFLLSSKKHKELLDEVTVVYWAMNQNEGNEDLLSSLLFGNTDNMNKEQVDEMLQSIMTDAAEGKVVTSRLTNTCNIDPDVDFYMVGIKPNASRLSVKFIYRKKFGDILWNIAQHQKDMRMSKKIESIALWQIKKELISPKSKNENVSPALISKLLESIMYGTKYPSSLLETNIRRIKTDAGQKLNSIRVGIIKAYINRKKRIYNKEEEFKLALDKENKNQAYLCGRLFAVLEKLQQDISNNSLNRTIKDSYFASASSKPAIVFPKLLKLAQNHLNKSKSATYYNILIGEIIDGLNGEFPDTLLLEDQGRFIIGYYQEYQNFFIKKEN